MASGKERLRIERQMNALLHRLDRQKKALDRLTLVHLEASAALMEISAMEGEGDPGLMPVAPAIVRANEALDRMSMVLSSAAAVPESEGESTPPVNPPNEGETNDGND